METSNTIRVTDEIVLPMRELEFEFVRSSGPGGQNVNKVATAVQLRFDAASSEALPDEVRARLLKLAGRRATADGVLILLARRFRTQERNRSDAIARLVALIQQAAEKPKPRLRTKPSRAAKRQRVDEKRRQSKKKQSRKPPSPSDD